MRITGMANRIFVVDDEKNIADTLAMVLRKHGHEANAFYDAESALHQIEVLCPEIVISDVVMPGLDGVELAILIRKRHPECRILLFSGQTSTANILDTAGKQGFTFECLAKPIHPADLLARVETLGHECEAVKELTLQNR
jgi:DNA-binding response OmpR family regulator